VNWLKWRKEGSEMSQRTRIALIFGGQSAEHAVSLESAKNVMDALSSKNYEVSLVAIDKQGVWRHLAKPDDLRRTDVADPIDVSQCGEAVWLRPTTAESQASAAAEIFSLSTSKPLASIDVVFPILHGPYGEDGTIQGFFRLMGLPFVGSGVLGSAVGMDKDVSKRLLRDAGLPVGKFICLNRHEKNASRFQELRHELGLPFFVKPANMGSSVGVYKVNSEAEYQNALMDAFRYDLKVMVEEFIRGREIECSVLGNHDPRASVPGEIVPQHDFYSYEAKYLDENGARLQIPAKLSESVAQQVRDLAIRVYKTLECSGMSRVDFFVTEDDRILVNEINTIPGFTKISMYPKMWNASGITYSDLIDQLVRLAIERTHEEKSLAR